MFYPAKTGGVGTYLRAKSRWLKLQKGIRHTVVAPAAGRHPDPDVVGIPSLPIPYSHGFRWPVSPLLTTRCLQRLQPHLIEVGDPYQFAWSALRAKKKLHIAALAFYHSDLPQLAGQRFGKAAEQAAKLYVSRLYQQFDLVLAPSRVMVEKLRALGISKVQHQALGVDTTIFSPQRADASLRQRLGVAANTRLVVYAGRFTREKNLPLLIQAIEGLGAPYHLLLIGSDILPCSSAYVSCLPFQSDAIALATLLASCDLFVHPGHHETFGLVVLEALACGLPALGMAGGGVAELIDSECGLLVAPGSSHAIAQGIRRMFRADLRAMGRAGRKKMLAHYDWNCIMPDLMAHYARLVTGCHMVRAHADNLGIP